MDLSKLNKTSALSCSQAVSQKLPSPKSPLQGQSDPLKLDDTHNTLVEGIRKQSALVAGLTGSFKLDDTHNKLVEHIRKQSALVAGLTGSFKLDDTHNTLVECIRKQSALVAGLTDPLKLDDTHNTLVESIRKQSALVAGLTGSFKFDDTHNTLVESIRKQSVLVAGLTGSFKLDDTHNKLVESIRKKSTLVAGLDDQFNFHRTHNKFLESISSQFLSKKLTTPDLINSSLSEAIAQIDKYNHISMLFNDDLSSNMESYATINSQFSAEEEQEVIDTLSEVASTKDSKALTEIYKKIPAKIRFIIWVIAVGIVWQIIVGAAGGVVGNILTPYVQSKLELYKLLPLREQEKQISQISLTKLGVMLGDYRFVKTSALKLRATPNARGPIIDELQFGQVVHILSTQADWTEVLYEFGDGSTVSGWVFTRYLAKFRR